MSSALREIFAKARKGELPGFARVVHGPRGNGSPQKIKGQEFFFDRATDSWQIRKIGRTLAGVPPELVVELENCFVNAKGAILGPGMEVISPSPPDDNGPVVASRTLSGSHVFGLQAKTSFGHWLLHRLPLIFSGLSRTETREVLVSSSSWEPFSLLAPLGVEPTRVTSLPMDRPELFFKVESLIVASHAAPPSKERIVDWKRLSEMVAAMSAGAAPAPENSPTKVYLTRTENSGDRSGCQNRELLEQSLRELGFAVIAPEAHSFSEQISILRGARHVAVEAGSASLLSVFSPQLRSLTYLSPQPPHRIVNGTALYAPWSRATTILRRAKFRYARISRTGSFSAWSADEQLLREVTENF
jgi:hypothetical protein